MSESPEFVPYYCWNEFDPYLNIPQWMHPHYIGTHPTGVRYRFGPLVVEVYKGNGTPDITLSKQTGTQHTRLVLWRTLPSSTIPKGWFRINNHPDFVTGYIDLHKHANYFQSVNKQARKEFRDWVALLQSGRYEVLPITSKQFLDGYKDSVVAKRMGTKLAQEYLAIHAKSPDRTQMWGVYDSNKTLVGGIGIEYSPSHNAVHYGCGFYNEVSKHDIGVGMFHHIISDCMKNGIQFVELGVMWQKGDNPSWRGFSAFKKKFITDTYISPPIYYKIIPGNLIAKVIRFVEIFKK